MAMEVKQPTLPALSRVVMVKLTLIQSGVLGKSTTQKEQQLRVTIQLGQGLRSQRPGQTCQRNRCTLDHDAG